MYGEIGGDNAIKASNVDRFIIKYHFAISLSLLRQSVNIMQLFFSSRK